jgi:hypothetical protein
VHFCGKKAKWRPSFDRIIKKLRKYISWQRNYSRVWNGVVVKKPFGEGRWMAGEPILLAGSRLLQICVRTF